MTLLAIGIMVIALFLTPLGLPGNWIMIAVLAAGAYYGYVHPLIIITCVLLAAVAEVIEFMLVKRLSLKYGGSRRAFWGAIAGGIVGALVGAPVPVVGSIIAGFAGSFAGAALVTYRETRSTDAARRVGWGVLLGRAWAAAAKTAAGVAILVLGASAFLL
jgi:hypothetical protein